MSAIWGWLILICPLVGMLVVALGWRALPGREDSDYWGDHFVVITGMVGDAFLYNDPIDRGGLGYDRVMSADTLAAAMNGSSSPGAAFAIGRT